MRLTDTEFFINCLKTDTEELQNIHDLANEGNFAECRKILAAYVRGLFDLDKFFKTTTAEPTVPMSDVVIEKAENAVRHYVVSCGMPYDFKGETIDWTLNPTENNYMEWPWILNRHEEWLNLARAYRATKDMRYVDAFCEMFTSWQEQALLPENEPGHKTICWRTIEAGIRQGLRWPEVIHSFYDVIPDDILVDWCKSVYEHAHRLYYDHTDPTGGIVGGNWFLMEMNGLSHIAVLYPFFKDSAMWLNFAKTELMANLYTQIYPDGAQFELSTDYQSVVVLNYVKPMLLYKAYGIDFPSEMLDIIEKAMMFFVWYMRPDGLSPSINDGYFINVRQFVSLAKDLYPNNCTFQQVIRGEVPDEIEKSYVFEYPGLAVLRSGWGKDDSFVSFDGGEFGEGEHQHEDKLSFTFFTNGKEVLCEGNNYAYDTSEMRKYVRCALSHNTVMIDGMGQNRRRDYKWESSMLSKKSDIKYRLAESVDAVSAVYNEGYGDNCEKLATHQRNLYFVKLNEDLKPFVIVCDRLISEKEHNYEIMWHLDSKTLVLEGYNAESDDIRLVVPQMHHEIMGVQSSYACTFPHLQGWTANSEVQHDYRPVYNVSHHIKADNLRMVTVLCPKGDVCVKAVEASNDINDTAIKLTLTNGKELLFYEKDYID